MSQPRQLTYFDAIAHLGDFAGGRGASVDLSMQRHAILMAYEEFAATHNWHYLYQPGRIQLVASQTTGTCAYDHSGGSSERLVTLTDATCPDWIEDASIRISDIICDVERRVSSTTFTLDATLNPGADVAAGTSYTLWKRYYLLPNDFASMSRPMSQSDWRLGQYVEFERLHELMKYQAEAGTLDYYSIAAVPDAYGSIGFYPWPPADTTEPLDFIYKRRPRDIRYSGWDAGDTAGTIAVTAGSTTVTGSSTSFASGMAGSLLRIGSSSTNYPTGIYGPRPYAEERAIRIYASATSLTLDANVQTTRSGVKYCVSDPIDIPANLWPCFLAMAERRLAYTRNLDGRRDMDRVVEDLLLRAQESESHVGQRRVMGRMIPVVTRLADGTVTFEDEA